MLALIQPVFAEDFPSGNTFTQTEKFPIIVSQEPRIYCFRKSSKEHL